LPESTPFYDAIVVGSGASGGWACKHLSEAGLKVALVDVGRPQPDKNFDEHEPVFRLKYRDRAQQIIRKTRPMQGNVASEFNYEWFCNDLEEPYTVPQGMPFAWMGRLRVTGGRTNVWGRQSYRFSDLDFKAASCDGYGDDWPLSYKDITPYYDLVEEYVGITGMPEGVDELPDGKFHPPMALTCTENLFRNRSKQKFGRVTTLGRSANITKPINGRAPCHYCGPCWRGCVTHSYFNSAFTTVADALKTGRCTHIPNAMAYQVLMDKDRNRAKGLLYIDRITQEPREVQGRAVVLCAQALESVRILFNSANRQYPNGLANSSGVLGHYLMDHIMGVGASGELPDLAATKPSLSAPHRPDGIYVIRFRNTLKGPRDKRFLRGYGFQGGSYVGFNWGAAGFGEAYKNAVTQPLTSFRLGAFGECLARWDNYVEIDPDLKDVFGIPVLRIHMTYGPNEKAMAKDMVDSAAEMLEAVGARNIKMQPKTPGPGWAIHEVGIARMGTDPRKSVMNQFQQTHDIKNLFVMDGAGFTSTACQNPTLTIMALCVRSCDYLLGQLRRGEV
jgi:choline dehydrogenase-like flavoprotein